MPVAGIRSSRQQLFQSPCRRHFSPSRLSSLKIMWPLSRGVFMRIAIIAPGSRGDVEPYIALGKGLGKARHVVRLVTHQNFEMLVNSHGLEFWPVEGNVQDLSLIHISEPTRLGMISYAVFCLKKK